ncbi:hypothetical protein QR680_016502 [Steinernema hermaphroditum]|uniref:Uncharacterized protein n=1 Tax=Steinernema hermaphroditum TaxID=289476 RepID=A0AA39HCI9_9BILA|nr:hypothetical protein QR680_016502 [Steinernema hermaphroditum]
MNAVCLLFACPLSPLRGGERSYMAWPVFLTFGLFGLTWPIFTVILCGQKSRNRTTVGSKAAGKRQQELPKEKGAALEKAKKDDQRGTTNKKALKPCYRDHPEQTRKSELRKALTVKPAKRLPSQMENIPAGYLKRKAKRELRNTLAANPEKKPLVQLRYLIAPNPVKKLESQLGNALAANHVKKPLTLNPIKKLQSQLANALATNHVKKPLNQLRNILALNTQKNLQLRNTLATNPEGKAERELKNLPTANAVKMEERDLRNALALNPDKNL